MFPDNSMLARAEEIEEEVTRAEAPAPAAMPPPILHVPHALRACWHWFRRTSHEPNSGRASPVDIHLPFSAHTAPSCSPVLVLESPLLGRASKLGPVPAAVVHVPPWSPPAPGAKRRGDPRGCISAG